MTYITKEQRDNFISNYSDKFKTADPFPYVVIDNFMNPDALQSVLDVFPTPQDLAFINTKTL